MSTLVGHILCVQSLALRMNKQCRRVSSIHTNGDKRGREWESGHGEDMQYGGGGGQSSNVKR